MVTGRWHRIPALEAWLDELGVGWSYCPEVPIAQVRPLPWADIDGRHHAYAAAMRDGATFPALAAIVEGHGLATLGDGNNRYHAALDAELPTVDTYLLFVADHDVRNTLLCGFNTVVGRG